MNKLLVHSALELARLVREGSLSSEEVVAFYLDRITRHDGRYGSFVAVYAERALAEARRKDRARTRDREALPPFHGVPVGVKDLHPVRWTFTRMGSRSLRYLYTPFDDATVKALRRAGFVILGKTATSELALLPFVDTDVHPPARNPWNPDHYAGGSSGGAGAAVAAGLLPIAPGSDGAGSIRIPAAFCGLFGFKPSRGRVPNPHAPMDRLGMISIGPLARDADDAAALLDVLAGRDPRAPGSFLEAARTPPSRLSIGILADPPVGETAPVVGAALDEAARALAAIGHRVEARPRVVGTVDEFMPIYQRMLATPYVPFESKMQPVTRWFRVEGRRRGDGEVRTCFDALAARAEAAFGGSDILISPTTPIVAPRVGAFRELGPEETFRAVAPIGAFTAACNIAGAPAASVPWTRSGEGLPIGVQIIGRPGDDERVLSLARELLARRPHAMGLAPSAV